VYLESTGLYADAVQRMVLDGLDDEGVDQLASLSYAILSKLDPQRRLAIMADTADEASCAADALDLAGVAATEAASGKASIHR
jgi:hypothetical protein